MLPSPTTHAAGATLNGRFYVIGGRGGILGTQRATILAVDPVTGRAVRAGKLPVALSDLSAGSLAGHVVAVGGRDPSGRVHDAILDIRHAA